MIPSGDFSVFKADFSSVNNAITICYFPRVPQNAVLHRYISELHLLFSYSEKLVNRIFMKRNIKFHIFSNKFQLAFIKIHMQNTSNNITIRLKN